MKDWQVTLAGFIGLVVIALLGGAAFHFLETDNEARVANETIAELSAFLAQRQCINLTGMRTMWNLLELKNRAGLRVSSTQPNPIENVTNWDLKSAIFLSFQVIGSVGFGNAPPVTAGGKVFNVFYILCAIPLLMLTSRAVGQVLRTWADMARCCFYRRLLKRQAPKREIPTAALCNLIVLFVVGFILLVIVPAVIFYSLEQWTFGEAMYSTLMVTLTVGFSDFVPGADAPLSYRSTYRILVGIWIIFNLYWFSGVLYTLFGMFNYREQIVKPLDEVIKESNDEKVDRDVEEKQIRVKKDWKKKLFDKHWQKPTAEIKKRSKPTVTVSTIKGLSSSDVDVFPVYNRDRFYPAISQSPFGSKVTIFSPTLTQ